MTTPTYIAWEQAEPPKNRPVLADFDLLRKREDVEWTLLTLGEKPAAKLEDLDQEHLAWYMAHAAAKGIFAKPVSQSGAPSPEVRGMATAGRHELFTLFLAWNEHAVDELVRCEATERAGGPSRGLAQERSGILLGYPPCCVSFMSGLARQEDDGILQTYRSAGSSIAKSSHKVLNFLPPLVSPVTWFPCSLHCSASEKKGTHYLAALARADHERAEKVRAVLPGVVLAFRRFCFVHLHGAHVHGAELRYSGVSDALSYTSLIPLSASAEIKRFRAEVTHVLAQYRRVFLASDAIVLHCGRGRTRTGKLLKTPLVLAFPGARGGELL